MPLGHYHINKYRHSGSRQTKSSPASSRTSAPLHPARSFPTIQPQIPSRSKVAFKQGCPVSGLLFNKHRPHTPGRDQGTASRPSGLAFADDLCTHGDSP
ncbi:hypothetical protein AVEN_11179-1 [Araneus ventricosus]|uniref:Uncharacterized protein n=1 Tax=Araneus ventricosus TaxID=182803 RepID=A0A4Y2TBG2_ARAVE|nr:hypothetical protein AVEN_11179-1 [Araneus ventricosus]